MYIPQFLKFVLTIERRPSKNLTVDKILEMLATQNVVELKDKEISESKSYLEFALTYGAGIKDLGPL